MTARPLCLAPLALLLGCATTPPDGLALSAQDAFWHALSSHCGKAYTGRLVSDEAPDAEMRGRQMAMHVRECSPQEIKVPFHIERADGLWDRSRTWVFTRTATGLRLKHDHRHEDGTPDVMTMYGGDTASPGTAAVQEFPVDAESIALFQREGRSVSITNVWRVEVDWLGTGPARFVYQLQRKAPNARNFRVEFDLGRQITPPPPPWGHAALPGRP
ncbi:MAG: hypothetical protein ACK44O_05290 [Novosphingobium sp.]|jgi:hypothetical protein|uniref:hypothetical protein n=1 Tax=Novosphingobium sp. TaxID=1874826 RepID=UPI00391C3F20|nr:hypothetical protein [Novosphingobium sp.]